MTKTHTRRPRSVFLSYPAFIADAAALDALGMMTGTGNDPARDAITMSRTDWDRFVATPSAHGAIVLLGDTWVDNPLIPQPAPVVEPSISCATKRPTASD